MTLYLSHSIASKLCLESLQNKEIKKFIILENSQN